jgi:hypothetical protein
MAQERDIKYVGKTFSDFRQQLIDYSKNYFPDTYNDFSPTSPGMMFMEMAAYVGDVLSFYQDIQLQETFLQYAQEPGNLYNLAYMMGYRPKVSTAATVELTVEQVVPAILISGSGQYVPNFNHAVTISENAILQSTTNPPVQFLVDNKINFTFSSSYDPTEVSIYATAGDTITEFLLQKKVKATSAEIKTTTVTVTSPERFKTITLQDSNILGVLDIVDTNGSGSTWYEVPYLGQDTVFIDQANSGGSDSNLVPYVLQLQKVPRRFVSRFTSTGDLQVQFGAGASGQSDSIITPDPTNVGLGDQIIGVSQIDKAYDPSNFMFTGAYGLAPANTVLRIRYLVGGGVESNVPSDTITTIISAPRSATIQTGFENRIQFTNPESANGGKDGDNSDELRENSLKAYSEQLRAVTTEDYVIRTLSLPAKFGSVAKAYVIQDQLSSTKSATDNIVDGNPLSLSLFVLAYDNSKKLTTASSTLRSNLSTYLSQYKLITDAVNIKDAFIVNIGVRYDIVVLPNFTGRDVLLSCTQALQDYFRIEKWSINQSINLSALYTLLDRVKGVQTVQNIEIDNKVGGNYSQYGYDVKGATKNNIVYPSYDPCIFEIKFPDTDIVGRVTSL